MTKLRTVLLGLGIAVAVAVPAGAAYAATTPDTGPGTQMAGHPMDRAACQSQHDGHRARMKQHGAKMGGAHDQMQDQMQDRMRTGSMSMPGN